MIGVRLYGYLGNQMFQYVAARAMAARLGCRLVFAGYSSGRRYGAIGHLLGLDRVGSDKKILEWGLQQNGLLYAAFGCGPTVWQERVIELSLPHLQRTLFPRSFSPRRFSIGDSTYEEFDETFFDQVSGTWFEGYFQSSRYFADHTDQVRSWFRPSPKQERRLNALITQWPQPPQNMVAVHIRRGDYANIHDGVGSAEQGWLLPPSYYRGALERLPRGTGVAVFSDDPDWAGEALSSWRPWVARGNKPSDDMLLIGKCRWNVIANSSFSWWAAWLNGNSNKVVMAPKFHLGWRVGRWVPGGVDVKDWEYINV